VKIAILSPRYPERGGKGDQQRAFFYAGELFAEHEVWILTNGRPSSERTRRDLEEVAYVAGSRLGRTKRTLGSVGAASRGLPGQVGWMTPLAWWRRVEPALREIDVVLAMTVRALPGPSPAPLVLDHVDALSLNMARRAKGPERLPVRLAAGVESRRLREHERRAAGWARAQLVTSAEDAAHLPQSPEITLLPAPWDGDCFEEPSDHRRDIDVILTGDMRYPPNRSAATWLTREVVPLVRRRLPAARIWIVGRAAASLVVEDVEIASDVPDIHAYLRRAKVAAARLEGGTGSPIKVLEAAANGAAVVANAWSLRPYGFPGDAADTPQEFAQLIIRYLEEETLRREAVAAALPALHANSTAVLVRRLETVLRAAADRPERPESDSPAESRARACP